MDLASSALSSASQLLGFGSRGESDPAGQPQPKPSVKVRVGALYIHPIKSCRGTSVQEAEITKRGFKYDRTWLIIDGNTRKFYTARDLPKLVTIYPEIIDGHLKIHIPDDPSPASVPLEPTSDEIKSYELITGISIWAHEVDGYAVSDEADRALSKFLGKEVRLVMKGPSRRPGGIDKPAGDLGYEEEEVNFQDQYPFLLTSFASLSHVKKSVVASATGTPSEEIKVMDVPSIDREYWTKDRCESIEIVRFRPNIVVEAEGGGGAGGGLNPFEEDGWVEVQIGEEKNTIYCVARCARCMVPNVDPGTGVRDKAVPYLVLSKYRKVDPGASHKPCFGVNGVPKEASGTIRVGDVVAVVQTCDPDARVYHGLNNSLKK